MGRLLHRVGRTTATHPVITILVWVLVLGAAVGGYLALSRPLTQTFAVPDSEFTRVLDELADTVPIAAGGVGTVAIRSEKPFTEAQERALGATIADWTAIDHVTGAMNPFTLQRRLDDNTAALTKGRAELADGRVEFDAGAERLRQAQGLAAAGQQNVDRARRADDPDLAQLEKAQAALERQLQDGGSQLADARRKLAAGQRQLDVGQGLLRLAGDTRFVSADGRTAIVQLRFDRQANDMPTTALEEVMAVGDRLEQAGVRTSYGQDISHPTEVGGVSEVVGLVAAAIVLIVLLGSLVLAGLPLVIALVGVGTALPLALILTHWFDFHSVTPVLGLMLGLAVGIDYGLFIVNRHRMTLAARGRAAAPTRDEIRDSIAGATGTAGTAVTVAGCTVALALAALVVTGIPALAQMGLVGASAVAATVLVALTLTPALLALVGRRAVPERRPVPGGPPGSSPGGWPQRWYATVTRRPRWTVVGVVAVLAVIAAPALTLRLGLPDGGQDPRDTTSYAAFTQIEKAFGPGTNGPIIAVTDLPEAVATSDVASTQLDLGRQIAAQPYVRDVLPIGVSEDRRTLAFQVVPTSGPSDERTVELVHELQTSARESLAASGVTLGITGQAAANIEISQKLADALPLYLVIVIGMSLLLLVVVFRSVVVPLVATAGYLLSAAASFGAVVAVYQWGWLGSIFGVTRPGAVISFLPIILIGIVFGLAMDYQMFLVSGMHEAHRRGRSARRAVRIGFVSGARVVAAAALIMVCVFGSFVFAPMATAKPIGLGLAAGVLFDAFGVRMTLTPAVMRMLGERAWYLPGWLRWLPEVDVEGREAAPPRDRRGTAAVVTGGAS